MKNARKVTEIVGDHDRCWYVSGHYMDAIRGSAEPHPVWELADLLPKEAIGKRGRWRIVVEWEEE